MEHNNTIYINISDKQSWVKYAEGFIHNIYKALPFVYKLAKPEYLDYLTYEAVIHELKNMQYLSQKGFCIAKGYQVFRCDAGYGLRMSFVQGTLLSKHESRDIIFFDILHKLASIREPWAGPIDNRFPSWNQYLLSSVRKQFTMITQIPKDDCSFLCGEIGRVACRKYSVLLIDANLDNFIVGTDSMIYLLDMDRLILGDALYQDIYMHYQRGNISLTTYPKTRIELLYAVLITIEDLYFRVRYKMEYFDQLELYKNMISCLKKI